MSLHFPTLLLTEASALVGLSLLCMMLTRAEASLGLLRILGLGHLALAVAMPAYLLRGGEWHLLGVMLGNGAALLGWGLHLTATRRLAGRPGSVWIGPLACLGWCLLCLSPDFMASLAARTYVASAGAAGLTGMVAWDLIRSWTGWPPFRGLILLVGGSHPLILVARAAALAGLGEAAHQALNSAVILSGFLHVAAVTLIVVAEAMRRAGVESQRVVAAAHAEAAASRDLLAQVIEAMPCVIYVARMGPGVDGQRTFLSPNTERVIGWPRGMLDATDALDSRTEQSAAERAAGRVTLAERGEFVRELQMRRPDGSRLWVRRHSRISGRRPDGTCDVVGTITDITAERDLAAQVQASARLASLGEMATNLAHELGQPATTMCLAAGNAARALRNRGEAAIPDALRRLDRIAAQGERMGALLEHVKAFTRAGPVSLGPVAVRAAVEGALMLTGAALRQAEVMVEQDIPDGLPMVRAQLVPLEQVLVNLLLNACDQIRALPPGAPRRIRLQAAPGDEGMVAITLADSGGGLDPAVLGRLFEPFVTTKPPGEGLGLGLSVSHGLVRGMGGTITAGNGQDGAVFTVTLPCVLPLDPA